MSCAIHSSSGAVFNPVTTPTKPMSSGSPAWLGGRNGLQRKISVPEKPRAFPPSSLIIPTMPGLISLDKTCSTTSTDFGVVTRYPCSNRVSTPACSSARVIAFPPPCTMTGLMPTASMKTTSRATPLRTAGSVESIKLPPYLMTNVSPRNRCIYGNASSNVSALAMRLSIS